MAHLGVVRRDDEDVVEREVALGAGGVRVAAAVEQLRDLLGDPVGLLGRGSGGSRCARPRAAARPRPTAPVTRPTGARRPRPPAAGPRTSRPTRSGRRPGACARSAPGTRPRPAGRSRGRRAGARAPTRRTPRGCVPCETCASCCGSPSSTIPRPAPAIASASASAICPASSTNSTSTEPRSSSRAHSHGVPAIRLIPSSSEGGNADGVGGRAHRVASRSTDSGLPPPDFLSPRTVVPVSAAARSTSASRFAIALCEVAATPTRLPRVEQLADQPRARVRLARAGRALDEQHRPAEVGHALAERARRAAAAASAAAARTPRSGR